MLGPCSSSTLILISLYSHSCIIFSFQVCQGLKHLLPANGIHQKQSKATYKIRLPNKQTNKNDIHHKCSQGSQLPCCELSYGKPHVARNWGRPLANNQHETQACEELNPVNYYMSKFGSEAFPSQTLRKDHDSGWHTVTVVSWETLNQGHMKTRFLSI